MMRIEDVEGHALLIVRHLENEGLIDGFERVETREELQRAPEESAGARRCFWSF